MCNQVEINDPGPRPWAPESPRPPAQKVSHLSHLSHISPNSQSRLLNYPAGGADGAPYAVSAVRRAPGMRRIKLFHGTKPIQPLESTFLILGGFQFRVARSCFVTPRLLLRETGKSRGLKRQVRATCFWVGKGQSPTAHQSCRGYQNNMKNYGTKPI